MPKLNIDKHIVYTLIMNNLHWFESAFNNREYKFLTRHEIERRINDKLKKDYDADPRNMNNDPPYVALNAATLTAMAQDGVMERKYSDSLTAIPTVLILNARKGTAWNTTIRTLKVHIQ